MWKIYYFCDVICRQCLLALPGIRSCDNILTLSIVKKPVLAAAALLVAMNATAADFFSTEQPADLFNIGVHFGINTSNRTMSKKTFDVWNHNSWGTGIDVGATVDINFRDWFSIQPGFFFDSRSGNYAYSQTIVVAEDELDYLTQFGHGRSYNFIIPIMAIGHFNLTDDVRWNVEVGPYLQIGLHNSLNDKAIYPKPHVVQGPDVKPEGWKSAKTAGVDFGFKFGTSLTILKHYNVGVHYLAGCLNAWKPGELGGCNKEWVFSIGYIF